MKAKCVCVQDVKLDPLSGLLKVDGIPIMRFIRRNGSFVVQFMDGNKPRSDYRGSNLVELKLDEFLLAVSEAGEQFVELT